MRDEIRLHHRRRNDAVQLAAFFRAFRRVAAQGLPDGAIPAIDVTSRAKLENIAADQFFTSRTG